MDQRILQAEAEVDSTLLHNKSDNGKVFPADSTTPTTLSKQPTNHTTFHTTNHTQIIHARTNTSSPPSSSLPPPLLKNPHPQKSPLTTPPSPPFLICPRSLSICLRISPPAVASYISFGPSLQKSYMASTWRGSTRAICGSALP